MLALVPSCSLSFSGPVPAGRTSRALGAVMESPADLETLANKANPILGFYDPLNLAGAEFWGMSNEATIGWLRHAEIKHGRIAMFGFVGYCAQANGIHWPGNLNTDGLSFAQVSAAGSPFEQWDALPSAAKLQIIGAIGLFEWLSESKYVLEQSGEKHYTRGGTPGKYPSLKTAGIPHPVPFDLFNPFGFLLKGATPEKKAAGLVVEINNGRLAMFGIMGFAAAAKVPGSVPALTFIPSYAGEPMAPFSAINIDLPMVADMLKSGF